MSIRILFFIHERNKFVDVLDEVLPLALGVEEELPVHFLVLLHLLQLTFETVYLVVPFLLISTVHFEINIRYLNNINRNILVTNISI